MDKKKEFIKHKYPHLRHDEIQWDCPEINQEEFDEWIRTTRKQVQDSVRGDTTTNHKPK